MTPRRDINEANIVRQGLASMGLEDGATEGQVPAIGADGEVEFVDQSGGGSLPMLVGARGTQALTSHLYEVGSVPKPIGPMGFALSGLAYDQTAGVLYGVTSGNSAAHPRSLVTVDPASGEASFIGALGHNVSDIACDAAGNLYGSKVSGAAYQRLVSINKATGAGSVIGSAPAQALTGAGISFHPDGTLYLVSGDTGDSAQVKLYVINPATGGVTGPFGLSGISPDDMPLIHLDDSAWLDPIAAAAFASDGALWIAAQSTPGSPVKLFVAELLQDENVDADVVDSGITLGRDQVNGLDAIEWIPAT